MPQNIKFYGIRVFIGSPPEPEGTTVKWDFEEAGFVPVGWTNNGGTIADGSLNLSNGNNFVYGPEIGAGKYTWEIDVPLVGVGEKWLAGGNIAATNAEERSFSMFVFSGTENDRAARSEEASCRERVLRLV